MFWSGLFPGGLGEDLWFCSDSSAFEPLTSRDPVIPQPLTFTQATAAQVHSRLCTSPRRDKTCQCRLKCFDNISESQRRQIRSSFDQLEYKEQQVWLSRRMERSPLTCLKESSNRSRRARVCTARYFFLENDLFPESSLFPFVDRFEEYRSNDLNSCRKRVCLRAFLSILGMSSNRVSEMNKWMYLNECSEPKPDGRGKHSSRANKVPESDVWNATEFIRSRIQGLCSNAGTRVNVSELFREYLSEFQSRNVSEYKFRQIFKDITDKHLLQGM
jgi:hypothetical protein